MFGTKKKLMTAVVMLIISAIMMTSASYAWFTISTKPEITDLTTQVVVNENLEIALVKDAATLPEALTGTVDKQYTWGNIINLSATGDAKSAYDNLTKTLRPAKLNSDGTDSAVFNYPNYGSDGRMSNLNGILSDAAGSDGFGNLKRIDDGKIYGYYVDFWLRSNVGGVVALTKDAMRTAGSSGDLQGGGSDFETTNLALAENIRIAFKVLSVGTGTPSTTVIDSADISVDSSGSPTIVTSFTHDDLVTLVPNEAARIRMYVYLDGEKITNAAASVLTTSSGSATSDGIITGKLNIQFKLYNKEIKSMDSSDIK